MPPPLQAPSRTSPEVRYGPPPQRGGNFEGLWWTLSAPCKAVYGCHRLYGHLRGLLLKSSATYAKLTSRGRQLIGSFEAQEQDAGQDEQAAQDLPVAQALAEDEESQQGGGDGLDGHNQVGHAGGQVLEADVVKPVAEQGGAGRQQEERAPAQG